MQDWIWRGSDDVAYVSAEIGGMCTTQGFGKFLKQSGMNSLFAMQDHIFELDDERIDRMFSDKESESVYDLRHGQLPDGFSGPRTTTIRQHLRNCQDDQSILSQRKDPFQFPEFDRLNGVYNEIRLYEHWPFGRVFRLHPRTIEDVISRPMAEDFSNAWMFLNRLRKRPGTKAQLIERIADFTKGVRL